MNAVSIDRALIRPAVLMLLVLSAGCVSKDISDLESYAAQVLARKGGQIEPLPPIKPYERYLYRAEEQNLRDPFRSFFDAVVEDTPVDQINDAEQQKYATEIQTHNREELENFELDALRMVGVLENTDNLWGIVLDQAGTVHRVTVGNYVGRNYGKITSIQEDRIDIREIIQDGQGRWEERTAALALADE